MAGNSGAARDRVAAGAHDDIVGVALWVKDVIAALPADE
jgi:hypothetical protein